MNGESQDIDNRDKPADPERRAALAKMGKYAGVTAPAVVALLTADASEAWAASGRGGGGGGRGGGRGGDGGGRGQRGPGHSHGPLSWLISMFFR